MFKRILLTLALAASIGGALAACNPSTTPSPSVVVPSTAPSTGTESSGTGSEAPSESLAVPSAS